MSAQTLKRKKINPTENEHHVQLRRLATGDKENVKRWLSDPYILRLTFVVPGPGCSIFTPFNEAAAEQYVNLLMNDRRRITFAIVVDGIHVGNIGIKEYEPAGIFAECFIEIGEENLRSQGIGSASMILLLDYAFDCLKLEEMRLEVLEFNLPAIRVYQRLGFVRTHRSGWHYDAAGGQYWQVYAMSLSSDRYYGMRKRLSPRPHLKISPFTEI